MRVDLHVAWRGEESMHNNTSLNYGKIFLRRIYVQNWNDEEYRDVILWWQQSIVRAGVTDFQHKNVCREDPALIICLIYFSQRILRMQLTDILLYCM
jgi:hypothetical protein